MNSMQEAQLWPHSWPASTWLPPGDELLLGSSLGGNPQQANGCNINSDIPDMAQTTQNKNVTNMPRTMLVPISEWLGQKTHHSMPLRVSFVFSTHSGALIAPDMSRVSTQSCQVSPARTHLSILVATALDLESPASWRGQSHGKDHCPTSQF